MHVVHITAHMGGGVGKILSRLIKYHSINNKNIQHTVAVLEQPEKSQFVDYLKGSDCRLVFCPNPPELEELVKSADIVQLEWWHHPLVAQWMASNTNVPMRLIVWSHVSGLHYPAIPRNFLALAHRFIFTSSCSLHADRLSFYSKQNLPENIDAIPSSAGFSEIPKPSVRKISQKIKYGYLGTLNFAKLHPQIIEYLKAVTTPGFCTDFYGDNISKQELLNQAYENGIEDRIQIHGYTEKPIEVLRNLDIFVYLLNPLHYGTTENVLLEAMASGVIPIVLDNPAEQSIIRSEYNGLVIKSPAEFAKAIEYLTNHPEIRKKLSHNASEDVRSRFSLENTESRIRKHYQQVMNEPKRVINFTSVFGKTPENWFVSCLGDYKWCFFDTNTKQCRDRRKKHKFLYEETKSSVFHFLHFFPEQKQFREWAKRLEDDFETNQYM